MKQYILKLKTTSTTNYALYDGTTALTDAQLTTLFTTAGSAYFTFDFDSLTPSATNAITIVDSSDTAVVTNTNLTDTIVETKDFKGTWSASATAFDTFVALSGVAMDEAQLSDLMGKIKEAGNSGIPTTATFWGTNYDSVNNRVLGNITLGGYYIGRQYTNIKMNDTSISFYVNSTHTPKMQLGINELNLENHKIIGVVDPTSAQDAATKNYVDTRVLTNAGAPTTSTVGTVGQVLEDTTNGKLYICTDATNPYVWEEVGAGGGGIQNALIIREWS